MKLDTQTQDGMRVRASAGAASFRREPTLEKALEETRVLKAQVEHLDDDESDKRTARQKAAQERAAGERVERLEAALDEMPAARAAKKAADRDKARVSSTDPEARVMKMPDGGYRPAYNWQFGLELSNFTAGYSVLRVITGVDVVNTGSDKAQISIFQPAAHGCRGFEGHLCLIYLVSLTIKSPDLLSPLPGRKTSQILQDHLIAGGYCLDHRLQDVVRDQLCFS